MNDLKTHVGCNACSPFLSYSERGTALDFRH